MVAEESGETREADSEIGSRLSHFAVVLRRSPHNLLSPRALDELEERHFPESLAFAKSLPPGPRVLDIGSGGGLPGIIVALARPDLSVELLDATRKKSDFLQEVAKELDLDIIVHHGRAEELSNGGLAGRFDVVTARAVAPLDRLVLWAAPFVRSGGTIHAIKGERWAEELTAAAGAVRTAGLEVSDVPSEPRSGVLHGDGPRVVVLRRRA